MESVIIVGGGIAGISAGIFLQKKGIPSVIYEKNDRPGGVCYSFDEKNFHFDLCCRLLNGIESGWRHKLMLETGAVFPGMKTESSPFEIYQNEGESFRVEWNCASFRKLLNGLCSNEDSRRIDHFFDTVEKFYNLSQEERIRPFGLLSLREKSEFLRKRKPYFDLYKKILPVPFEKWIAEWQSESVRKLWQAIYPDNYSLFAFFAYAAARLYGNSGRPVGGSKALIRRLTETYRNLGGRLETGAAVDEIVTDKKRVAGVRLGKRFEAAPAVVAACDLSAALTKLLHGQVKFKQAKTFLTHGDLVYPIITICYGLSKRFGIPDMLFLEDDHGVDGSPDLTNRLIEIQSYESIPGAAPPGKSAVVVNLRCDWYFWKNLRERSEDAYRQYKLTVVNELNDCMERHFPGFTDAVEVTKVLTPLSYGKLSVLYKGAWRGFAPTALSIKHQIPHFVSSCKGLYFCGQSVAVGGGIDAVTEDAYETVEYLLAKEKFIF